MLDTNVWTYLSEQGSGRILWRFLLGRGHTVMIPPATLTEAGRHPKPEIRDPLLRLLGNERFVHLRTEAAMEAEEWIRVAQSTNPAWMRTRPDRAAIDALNRFWTKDLPRVARNATKWSWENTVAVGLEARNSASKVVRENKAMRSANEKLAPRLGDLWVTLENLKDGERLGFDPRERVEAWRCEISSLWWTHLITLTNWQNHERFRASITGSEFKDVPTTYADWTFPWIDRARLLNDRAGWNRFWYRTVTAQQVPRSWLRWAVSLAQTDFRIGTGTGIGGDQQLSCYLVDADIFMTSDKAYSNTLESVRPNAPFTFAKVIPVPYDKHRQIETIIEILETASRP
jgi:hypothetical protein